MARLQRQVAEHMREARAQVETLGRATPDMRGPATPEEWQPSVSAPGTEAFKQDFARWESLKPNLLLALEKVERSLTDELREQETRDRLNAGGLRRGARRLPRAGREVLPVARDARRPEQVAADAVCRGAAGVGLRARVCRSRLALAWFTYAGAARAARASRAGLTALRALTLLLLVAAVLRPVRVVPAGGGPRPRRADARRRLAQHAHGRRRRPGAHASARAPPPTELVTALEPSFRTEVWTFGDGVAPGRTRRAAASAGRSD